LPNGKVLVAAGLNSSFQTLASAELYDPTSGSWTATGSLSTGRISHTATLLFDGKVLVAAGASGPNFIAIASAELYTSEGAAELTLDARVHRQRGNRSVFLTWSPADGGSITVLRDGVVIATTDDDGAVKDTLGTQTGTFIYQVCENDSGDCSNEVRVRILGTDD
jgi:hypothetical protein